MYCRVKQLSTDVSEVRAAFIIRAGMSWCYAVITSVSPVICSWLFNNNNCTLLASIHLGLQNAVFPLDFPVRNYLMHATRLAHLTLDLITVIVAGDLCITRMH
jgi:hypothetical protein